MSQKRDKSADYPQVRLEREAVQTIDRIQKEEAERNRTKLSRSNLANALILLGAPHYRNRK